MSSSFHSTTSSNMNLSFDEERWVIQIRRTLDEELEEDCDIPVSIFNVPKTIMLSNPDSYVPQQVALGPYHYWHPELYEMQRYKIAAAKRTQKQLKNVKFQNLVDQLIGLEPRIRACYHKYLDINGETLAWMMAVDACFLLEFLQVYSTKQGKVLKRITSRMSHLVDIFGRKSCHNAILRDLVMLENQIPLFLLRQMLEFQLLSLELADDMLLSMIMGLSSEELTPFKMMQEIPKVEVSQSCHLLDFLYQLIVPKVDVSPGIVEADDQNEAKEGDKNSLEKCCYVKQLVDMIRNLLSKLRRGPIVRFIRKALVSKPVKVILKLPWTILCNLPGIRILKQPVESCFSQDKNEDKPENNKSNNINKPPLVEEITIPSVTDLFKVGVKFVPTNGGILSISFDAKISTFHLPVVNLDVNSEVIFRNLVAYETCNASGPLVFTRYTELMNGIVDTEDDAKLLREKGIILSSLKSDEEVANLWNGMSRSVRLTKVPSLDQVIEDVNKYYTGRWKVKFGKFMKVYVFSSWKFLTFLAASTLLLLMTFQAFCTVYSCARTLRYMRSAH